MAVKSLKEKLAAQSKSTSNKTTTVTPATGIAGIAAGIASAVGSALKSSGVLSNKSNTSSSSSTYSGPRTSSITYSGPSTSGSSGSSSKYIPVDNSGNNYAELVGMSMVDRAALNAAKAGWDAADKAGNEAEKAAWHQQAEDIRARYNYSGGGDGSEYLPFPEEEEEEREKLLYQLPAQTKIQAPADREKIPEFSYEAAPTYVNKYQQNIADLVDRILKREDFSYDPYTDPLYQQYEGSYTRNGLRAMQDTLGQVSARTGGMASSYAGSAAQQTYNDYMASLSAKIPELQQLAYEMYQDEARRQLSDLNMLAALEQEDFNKYLTTLDQYNTDRSQAYTQYRDQVGDNRYDQEWDYMKYRDQVADSRYDQQWAYQLLRDQIADSRYDQEWSYQVGRDDVSDSRYDQEYSDGRSDLAWEREQYEREQAYNQAMDRAQILAAAGDFSGYRALGYSDGEIANLNAAYQQEQAKKNPSGGGGGGGSGGGSGSSAVDGVVATMLAFGDDNVAQEWLINQDVPNWQYDEYWASYKRAQDGGDTDYTKVYQQLYNEGIKTEADAFAYLYNEGYDSGVAKTLAGFYVDGWQKPTATQASLGTDFSIAWRTAREMYDEGRSEASIKAYLDSFSEKRLTQSGLDKIILSLSLGEEKELHSWIRKEE